MDIDNMFPQYSASQRSDWVRLWMFKLEPFRNMGLKKAFSSFQDNNLM